MNGNGFNCGGQCEGSNKTIEESSFASNLNDIENKYVDSLLNGELKQIYKGVQLKCRDFKQQMITKNLVQMDKDYVSVLCFNECSIDHIIAKLLHAHFSHIRAVRCRVLI